MSITYLFFDIVKIALYTILIRYRFYIVNIADISLPLKIIDIVNIATLTMGTLIFLFLIGLYVLHINRLNNLISLYISLILIHTITQFLCI